MEKELFKTEHFTIFYPQKPQVPNHLLIALNRPAPGIPNITREENLALFALLKKMAEIYKTLSIDGFVVAQYDTPQHEHQNRYVIEVIPHLPGFNRVKNVVDKIDRNRYLFFRSANVSAATYPIKEDTSSFWKEAFQKEHPPLTEKELKIELPYIRKESHELEADKFLFRHLLEGLYGEKFPEEFPLPIEIPETLHLIEAKSCPFCDPQVLNRQQIYEYNGVVVFYNFRKGPKEGCNFLIFPKRHTEKIYGLQEEEIETMRLLKKALVQILKERDPHFEIFAYIQDHPSVGQTVFHTHEQIVSCDPKTLPLTWTTMFLFREKISDDELTRVKETFKIKLSQACEQFKKI